LKKNHLQLVITVFFISLFIIVLITYSLANFFRDIIAVTIIKVILTLFVFFIIFMLLWEIYIFLYFKSNKFKNIKESIKIFIYKCNELNQHIEELKNSYINIKAIDYGQANYTDKSIYNYKRPEFIKLRDSKNVYNCSLSVCTNAKQQPFKYICKYFNIKTNEETLSMFERVLNDFSAAEQGKYLLKNERDNIIKSINGKIPYAIRKFEKNNLIKKLGFTEIDFSHLYFPDFCFKYVSAGGKSSMICNFVFNIENLNKFILYLADLIKFKKSIAGQRALMTSELREKIKYRDKYTCQNCGLSIQQEPNLLLEIDHIIPLAKNGVTTEENLQTLCWRCNRSKGAKIGDDINNKICNGQTALHEVKDI